MPDEDPIRERYKVSFLPTQPVPRVQMVVRLLVGPVVWLAAIWLALVLAGREHTMLKTLLVAGVAFVVWWFFLLIGVWMRRREERSEHW